MTTQFYLFLHIVGILLMFGSVIGAIIYGRLNTSTGKTPERRLLMMTHGIGLVIILVAGFGLIAKLQVGFPLWIWVKLLIWLLFGLLIIPAIKGKMNMVGLYLIFILLASTAAYLGIHKPF